MTENEKKLVAAACGCFLQQFSINLDTVIETLKELDKARGVKRNNSYYQGAFNSFSSSAATVEKICDQIEKNLFPGMFEYMESNMSLLEKQVYDILEIGGSNNGAGGGIDD